MMLRLVYVSEPCGDGERLAMASVQNFMLQPFPQSPSPLLISGTSTAVEKPQKVINVITNALNCAIGSEILDENI